MTTTAELQEWLNDLKRDVPDEPNRREMAYALERMMQVKMGMNTSNVNLFFTDQKEAMDSLIHEMEDRPGEFPSLDESVQAERIQALVEDLGLDAVWFNTLPMRFKKETQYEGINANDLQVSTSRRYNDNSYPQANRTVMCHATKWLAVSVGKG